MAEENNKSNAEKTNLLLELFVLSLRAAVMSFEELYSMAFKTEYLDDMMDINAYIKAAYSSTEDLLDKLKSDNLDANE